MQSAGKKIHICKNKSVQELLKNMQMKAKTMQMKAKTMQTLCTQAL